jgi:hypothetical protein
VLTVFVSPEFTGTPPAQVDIGTTPFDKWPMRLAGLSFDVNIGGASGSGTPIKIDSVSIEAQETVWDELLGSTQIAVLDPGGPAKNPDAPKPGDVINSFPANDAHDHLRSIYNDAIARSPREGRVQVRGTRARLSTVINVPKGVPTLPTAATLKQSFGALRPVGMPPAPAVLNANASASVAPLQQTINYYDRKRQNTLPTASDAAAAVAADQHDFHQWISRFGHYPWLLRKLGLLFDLTLTWQNAFEGDHYIWISAKDSPSFEQPTLRTHFHGVLNSVFDPILRSPDLLPRGCLALGDPSYQVVQTDLDGAALKAGRFGHHVNSLPDDEQLAGPALRTGALRVVHSERIPALQDKLARADALHTASSSADGALIDAEDLIRGYRFDVFDRGHWRSLCERSITYRIGTVSGRVDDVGWVSHGLSKQVSDHFLHQSVVAWGGWSVVAPKPGKQIANDDGSTVPTPNYFGAGRSISVHVRRGSLPTQRFGRRYPIRGEAVNLAGKPLLPGPIDDKDFSYSTRAEDSAFRRFEPINSPIVIPRYDLAKSAGQTVDHLVIRAGDNPENSRTSERHIAPPKISISLAEAHGMFDSGGNLRKDAYNRIRTLDGTSVVGDANSGLPYDEAQNLEIDYLADPFAVGVFLRGTPNPERQILVSFEDAPSFRLKLWSGDPAATFNVFDRVLTVSLPPATVMNVLIGCTLRRKDLDHLGVWNWIQSATSLQGNPSETEVIDGHVWALTPSRVLTLINAVQRPLGDPPGVSIDGGMPAPRVWGETSVGISGSVKLHVPSTGVVEVLASWVDSVDDPLNPAGAAPSNGGASALTRYVDYDKDQSPIKFSVADPVAPARFIVGDTKYHRVAFKALATTRFREFYNFSPDKLAKDPSLITKQTKDDARTFIDVPATARPPVPEPVCVLPIYGWPESETSPTRKGVRTTKAERRGGGLRVYLNRPWNSSGDGEMLAVVLWPGAKAWFDVPTNFELPDAYKPLASQWGMDPVWATRRDAVSLGFALTPDQFLNSDPSAQGKSFTLDELQNAPNSYRDADLMMIAAFPVRFDPTRQLWCADIHMDPGMVYSRFVRLALARFQPRAIVEKNDTGALIRDANLSRVVMADFVQLAPHRYVSVTEDHHAKRITITVTGIAPTGDFQGATTNEFHFSLEDRDPDSQSGWAPVPGKAVTVTASEAKTDPQDDNVTWTGEIVLDHAPRRGHQRIVLREFERFRFSVSGNANRRNPARLVFASTVQL